MARQSARQSALAPLREPTFRWYFLARLVNLAGSTMSGVALAFAVLEVSDSPSALGLVLAAHSIPLLVFLLVGGVIADRLGRTLVIQSCNIVAGLSQLAFAGLVISGEAQLWMLVVLSAVSGVAGAIAFPALAGLLPQLVPREQLQAANVLTSITRSGLTVIGPSIAALLVVGIGPGYAVAIDGVTYLVAAVLLSRIRLPRPDRVGATSALADLREGWVFFRRTTWLWSVVLAFSVICAVHQGAFFTLGPALAEATDLGAQGWGLILSAEAVGLVLTGLVMLRLRLERPLLWGMLGTVVYAAPLFALGIEPHLATAMVAAVVAGIGIEVFALGWNLAMQENVPEEMLSRAFSYDALGSFVAVPLGQLAAGPLALVFGIRPVMLGAGVLLVLAALGPLTSASVRQLPRAPTPAGEVSPTPTSTVTDR